MGVARGDLDLIVYCLRQLGARPQTSSRRFVHQSGYGGVPGIAGACVSGFPSIGANDWAGRANVVARRLAGGATSGTPAPGC
jgi:hypothetical protein